MSTIAHGGNTSAVRTGETNWVQKRLSWSSAEMESEGRKQTQFALRGYFLGKWGDGLGCRSTHSDPGPTLHCSLQRAPESAVQPELEADFWWGDAYLMNETNATAIFCWHCLKLLFIFPVNLGRADMCGVAAGRQLCLLLIYCHCVNTYRILSSLSCQKEESSSNTKRRSCVDQTLGHCLQRWPNI